MQAVISIKRICRFNDSCIDLRQLAFSVCQYFYYVADCETRRLHPSIAGWGIREGARGLKQRRLRCEGAAVSF